MTTPTPEPCVRGCTRRCTCPECTQQPVHPGEPRWATIGHMCRRCALNITDWLQQIPDLYATLDARPSNDYSYDRTRHHTKVSGSPAPLNLDIIVLTDRRTREGTNQINPLNAYYGDYDIETDDGTRDIAGELIQWATIFAEETGLTSRPKTIVDAANLLATWRTSVLAMPWADEFYTNLQQLRRLLGRAHGDRPAKPIARCISMIGEGTNTHPCDQPLYAQDWADTIRCRHCGRTYQGRDLVRLQVAQETKRA